MSRDLCAAYSGDDRQTLDDLLAGGGSLMFQEGDTQVRVGWLLIGGEGLIVTARVNEAGPGRTRFWCDARQWADWLAAELPVPSWEALPQAWRASAAALTLSPGGDAVDATWPQAVDLTPGSVTTDWRIGIVLQRGAHRLALTYLDGATSWLRERCRQATPCDEPLDPAGLPARPCALAVGWATLGVAQCDALCKGDTVLLDVTADIASGEYWLIDGDYAIPMRDGQPSGRGAVERMRTDAVTCLDVVIAKRPIPIPALMAWLAGEPAASPPAGASSVHAAACLTLWRDGAPWSSGQLLRFGDGRLGVQIDASGPAAGPIPDSDDEGGTDASGDEAIPISGGDPMGVYPTST